MSSEHEIRQRLDDAWELTERARSGAIAEAVQWADELGDERLMVETRVHLMRAYNTYYDAPALLAPLSWLLEKEKMSPELFDADAISSMLWCYKYAVGAVMDMPATTSTQIISMCTEFENYCRRHGASLRAAHARRYRYLRMCGRQAEAELALDAWRASPRDENSDCPNCDPRHEVLNYLDHGDFEAAWRAALPTINSADPCNAQPQGIEATLLIEMARHGHWREARLSYQRGVRLARRDAESLDLAGVYLRYLTATGRIDEALGLLRDTVRLTHLVESGSDLLGHLSGVLYLTRRLISQGRGDELLFKGTLAGTNPWHGFESLTDPTVRQADERLSLVVDELVGRFDARDSTTWHSDRLAEVMALPILDDPLVTHDDLTGVVVAPEPSGEDVQGADSTAEAAEDTDGTAGSGPVAAPRLNSALETYELSVPIPDDLAGLLDLAAHPEHVWHTIVRGRIADHLAEHHWQTSDEVIAALSVDRQLTYWQQRVQAAGMLGLETLQLEAIEAATRVAEQLRLEPEALALSVTRAGIALRQHARATSRRYDELGFPEHLERARAFLEASGPSAGLISALSGIAYAAARCRRSEGVRDAMELLIRATDQLLDGGLDPASEAFVISLVPILAGQVTMLGGDHAEACQLAEEQIQLTSASGVAAQGQALIGHASYAAGYPAEAVAPLREALNWYLATGQRVWGWSEVVGLAATLRALDRHIETATFAEQMLIRYDELPAGNHIFLLRRMLAESLLALSDHTGAMAHGEAVGDWFIVNDGATAGPEALAGYSVAATAAEQAGLLANAARLHTRVAAVGAKLGDVWLQSQALRRSAQAQALAPATSRESALDAVVPMLDEARSLLVDLELPASKKAWELADADEDRALVLWRLDENLEALDWVEAARQGFAAGRDVVAQARVSLLGARAAMDGALGELAIDYAKQARELFDQPELRGNAMLEMLEAIETELGLRGDE